MKGIACILKDDQRSHVCGVVVSKAKLILIYLLRKLLNISSYNIFQTVGAEKLVSSYWRSPSLLFCTEVTLEPFLLLSLRDDFRCYFLGEQLSFDLIFKGFFTSLWIANFTFLLYNLLNGII